MILIVLVACGMAYNALAIIAALRFSRRANLPSFRPPVSILKPVRGCDPGFYRAIQSHAVQDYPEFEILFGVADPDDPALADIERLQAEYPEIPIRVVAENKLSAALEPVWGRISTVGLVGRLSSRAEWTFLNLGGVSRFCPAGRMQFPPLTWHHEGRQTLAELVTWIDAEGAA